MEVKRASASSPPARGSDSDTAPLVDLRRDGDFVWRTLQRHGVPAADLDDALQEVFLVAHRRQGVFDPTQGKLTTWLFGICTRVAWSLRRRRRSHAELPELVNHETPETLCGRSQRMHRLSAALERLSPEHRATFVMFELEGVSCADIAAVSGVPVGTVHSRLYTARSALRRALDETDPEPANGARAAPTQAPRASGELP